MRAIQSMMCSLACLAGAVAPALAQDFKPETVTAVAAIPDGPHLYAHGQGKIAVIDPEGFKYQGLISTATAAGVWWGQALVATDGKSVYLSKTYYAHGTDGQRSDTLERWSVPTLTPVGEAPLAVAKQAMRGADRALIAMSGDGRWIYLQNATPATSITVFDTAAQQVASEIPLPGCWGVYPVIGGADRLVALCGDGRLSTVSIGADGKPAGVERSEKIFDVDGDPLFTDYQRDGNALYMVSFNGNLYRIDISGKRARLAEKYSLVDGTEGKWRPSSAQPLAYVADARVLYVLMHANADDRSHVKPANEVWAFDLKRKQRLSRSSVQDATGLVYFKGSSPMLFAGADNVGLVRYIVDPAAGYSVRKDKTMKLDGANALKVQ